jgi:hypothetical protein
MTVAPLENSDRVTYGLGPISRLPHVWVGFLFALAFFLAEVIEVTGGNVSGLGPYTIMSAIAGWWYWLFCVHRFHKILGELSPHVDGEPTYQTTPGKAVGYHFIPFYNLFWIFKWPSELVRYVNSQDSSAQMISGGILGTCLLLGSLLSRLLDTAIGISLTFGVGLYIAGQLRQTIKRHNQLREAANTFA